MNFHHLSLTRKLTIAFSILVAILIGVSTLSVVSLSESQRDFDSFVSDEFSRGGLARDVRAAASARAIAARNLIILHGPEDIQAETTAVKAAQQAAFNLEAAQQQAGGAGHFAVGQLQALVQMPL